jgi:hypothetical protein
VKEITEVESQKFDLRGLFLASVEQILSLKHFKSPFDEAYYRTEVIFKEGRFGYFNPLIIELNGSIQ